MTALNIAAATSPLRSLAKVRLSDSDPVGAVEGRGARLCIEGREPITIAE